MELLETVENLFQQYGFWGFLGVIAISLLTALLIGKIFLKFKRIAPYVALFTISLVIYLTLIHPNFDKILAYLKQNPYVLPGLFAVFALALYLKVYFEEKLRERIEEELEILEIERLEKEIKKLLAKKNLTYKDRLKLIEYQTKLTKWKEEQAYWKGYNRGYDDGFIDGAC